MMHKLRLSSVTATPLMLAECQVSHFDEGSGDPCLWGGGAPSLSFPPSPPPSTNPPTLTPTTRPAPSSVSRHQVVSRQSAGVQMCPPTTLRLLRLAHLSQGVFITHSVGPGISVGTTHPGCVMDPPAGCLVIRRSGIQRVPFLLHPLFQHFFCFFVFILSALRVLHISLIRFFIYFFPSPC